MPDGKSDKYGTGAQCYFQSFNFGLEAFGELDKMGIQTWPTDANFLLAKIGADVFDSLLQKGVIVRPMHAFGLNEHIRISVGLPEENERFIKALTEICTAEDGK